VETSPLSEALARVGDRWTLLLVEALLAGPARFGDLQEALPISSNVLASRLRRLEAERLVVAVPYSARPRRYAYHLTESGRGLAGALRLLAQWNDQQSAGAPVHAACGGPAVPAWWCPACDQRADAEPPDTVWV
jgi:DNA-binding HxlR family transcriptional regulator